MKDSFLCLLLETRPPFYMFTWAMHRSIFLKGKGSTFIFWLLQQFSPNNIHTLSRDKVIRINKMIVIEKISWSFIKFSQLILKGDVWRLVWRICMWILGLKGLRPWVLVLVQVSNLNSSSTVKSSTNRLSLSCLATPEFAFLTWLMYYSDTEIQTFDQSLIYL